LSIAAWCVIFLGYVLPFCFVATILTLNGYAPSSEQHGPFTVFPTPMGAPPGCIDQLKTAQLDDLPIGNSAECSVCMENFTANDTIVETECNHFYHRQCLADWLSNARTCPVCRMDIPEALERRDEQLDASSTHQDESENQVQGEDQHNRGIGIGPVTRTFARNTDMHHEIMMMHHQIVRRSEFRNRTTSSSDAPSAELRNRSTGSMEMRNRSRSLNLSQHDNSAIEEGRER
ncbi:MAG: RING finger domain-containing protein, partial [Pseudomonadota bacterium]